MINTRYSYEFKLQVITEYLSTSIGCRTLAKKYNLPSKNYIYNSEKQLVKKGLLSNDELKKAKSKTYSFSSSAKKTAYEKQLEKENFRLKAELAYLRELKKIVDDDSKKNSYFKLKKSIPYFFAM